jgi:uncharacterized protein
MPSKPSKSETEYFAREENEKIHRLAEQHRRDHARIEKEHERSIHFMKCPKCGANLKNSTIGVVDVQECTKCDTLVLAKGALEKVKVANHNLLKSLIDMFNKEDHS